CCTENDLAWVKEFHSRIINGSDPFTILRKIKMTEAKYTRQQAQLRQQEQIRQQEQARTSASAPPSQVTPQAPSLWERILSHIKGFFS
ncbi:MAG: hypothetical protein IJF08_09930, partial [Clostridia bacterium]|nr:hypothetical protein [Clostridia bacterium]